MNPNLVPYRSIHFVGILNYEMAGLVFYCLKSGCKVSGSDDRENPELTQLYQQSGVTCFDMFAQTNISKSMELIVLSPYYDTKHTEAVTAARQQIPVISATDFIKEITARFQRLAILGSYEGPLIGAWLSCVMNQAHITTNELLHALPINETEIRQPVEEADWFVLPLTGFKRDATTYEADFLSYESGVVIIPSIIYDYPELYMTLDEVYQSYYAFVKRVPRRGHVIGNGDYSRMKRLRSHLVDRHIVTYGFDRDVMWQIREVEIRETTTQFSLFHDRQLYGPFTIPGFGITAVYAGAAIAIAMLLMDLRPDVIGRGLEACPLLQRYLQTFTDKEGRLIIDDRADHPETISNTLKSVKEKYPEKKIWCLYQPGSYLRTKALFSELESALRIADFVYITDIQGYPKEKSEGMHIRSFVADMKRTHPQTYYFDTPEDMTALLKDRVTTTDCIITLGTEGKCQEVIRPLIHVENEDG